MKDLVFLVGEECCKGNGEEAGPFIVCLRRCKYVLKGKGANIESLSAAYIAVVNFIVTRFRCKFDHWLRKR